MMNLFKVSMNAGFGATVYFVACEGFDEAARIASVADGSDGWVRSVEALAEFGPDVAIETLLVSDDALRVLTGEAS